MPISEELQLLGFSVSRDVQTVRTSGLNLFGHAVASYALARRQHEASSLHGCVRCGAGVDAGRLRGEVRDSVWPRAPGAGAPERRGGPTRGGGRIVLSQRRCRVVGHGGSLAGGGTGADAAAGARTDLSPRWLVYSGPTAAQGYKLIAGRKFETVIILAASHTARFQGVSVPATTAYNTPLGRVPVSAKAAELATRPPFVREPRCLAQPPPWVAQAPGLIPQPAEATPETWEHSVEVHVPFLQRTLDQFDLLPLVFGEADPEAVAGRLAGMLDEHTLLIASTDLSHYHPYDQARALDQQCVRAICELNLERMKAQEACGKLPVLTLMHLARLKGWRRHTCWITATVETRPATRPGWWVTRPSPSASHRMPGRGPTTAAARPSPALADSLPEFSPAERRFLLELARETLVRASTNGPAPNVTEVGLPSARLAQPGACFVTLTRNGPRATFCPTCPCIRRWSATPSTRPEVTLVSAPWLRKSSKPSTWKSAC